MNEINTTYLVIASDIPDWLLLDVAGVKQNQIADFTRQRWIGLSPEDRLSIYARAAMRLSKALEEKR